MTTRRVTLIYAAVMMLALLGGCGPGNMASPSNPSPTPTPVPVTPSLQITTSSLPVAYAGSPYSVQLAAANGTGALTWSATSNPPPGLSLSSTGLLSGTPSAAVCPFSLSLSVTDSATPKRSGTATLSFTAEQLYVGLSAGQLGVLYQGGLNLYCGKEPVSWSLISGTIPPGLQMKPFPNVPTQLDFIGTPTLAGTFNFTVLAQDSNGPLQANIALTILPAALTLSDGIMELGVVNQTFYHRVALSGGTAPFSFAISSGSLPAGVQLNATTGEIVGVPTSTGLFQFSVRVVDSTGTSPFSVVKPYSLLITPAALPTRNDTIANATTIVPGTYTASLSAYTDAAGNAAPDQDYYVLTGMSGDIYEIGVGARYTTWSSKNYLMFSVASTDPAIEIVDNNGLRLRACIDPIADLPPANAPYPKGAGNYTDPCISHGGDGSSLTLKTLSDHQNFYLHVFDFNGRARPDFIYTLSVTKK